MLVNAKSILVKSKLPGADYVINPYIGCLNACTYCYAKFMLRFQRHWNEWGKFVDVKINAPGLLPTKSLKGKKVLMSSVTDPYQAVEKKYELTRKILKQLIPLQPSLFILTKSDLVLRDIDLLKQFKDCIVCFSMAFDENVRKRLEPGAQPLQRRVKALKKLRKAGIKAGIFIAPLIPGVTNWKKLVEVDADEYWFCKVNKKCDWDDENFVQKNYNWKKVREEVMDHCKDKNAVICF